MMRLISVQSAKRTAFANVLDLELTADLGNGNETLPFTYAPGDPHGLAPAVSAWLADNPAFPIADYVPPPPPDLDAIDTAELNRILTQPGSVVRAALEVMFLISKGTIAIDPARTKPQFIALLKARMRNGV